MADGTGRDLWYRWTDLDELHNFAFGHKTKGAKSGREMSIFAFFSANWRQRKPPLRGGDHSPQEAAASPALTVVSGRTKLLSLRRSINSQLALHMRNVSVLNAHSKHIATQASGLRRMIATAKAAAVG